MPNILVATLGGSWQIIPELLGYTNPDHVPLYAERAGGLDAIRHV